MKLFYKYVRYNTANNVSTFGGDPVTQLIVNVYQMIPFVPTRPSSVLMYTSETWTLRKAEQDLLERTEMRMVRWMMGIKRIEKITAEEISVVW